MSEFFDVYYQQGEKPVFSYRSGLAVYEETFSNGVLFASGSNAAGYPLNVLSNYPSRLNPMQFHEPSAFNIELDGQCMDYGLKFIDFKSLETENSLQSVLTLESGIKPVRINVHTNLDGTQMFTRFIEIENLSDKPMNLSRLSLISGGLETMERAQLTAMNDVSKLYSAGYFDNDNWGREGEFAWHDLTPGVHSVNYRFGRDRFGHPIYFLRNNITGKMYFYQIGWSGGCGFTADLNAATERNFSSLAFKAEITSHSPMLVINPHETFVSPEVHVGIMSGGLDEAVNEMHSHIRKSVLNSPAADPSACYVGAGMGAEHDMSVETSKAFIDQLAEMGAEIFIVDAGWECPPDEENRWSEYNGTNIPNSDRYPDGIGEVRDYCHSKGLKFGLWVDIETLGSRSEIFEKHPEWRSETIIGNKSANLMDFSIPEAAEWAENELARIISEYKLDLLRVDHNVSFRDYFTMRNGECTCIRHIQTVYAIYQRLKRRFPDVIFENCAGGGARTDLGMMKSFNHTWVSDWQKPPRSVAVTNGMTMALPPERVDRLFAGMGCHENGSLDFHMRNCMLGHVSLNVVSPATARINPVQMDFIRHSVDIYKNFIREFLPASKIYHHTPETAKTLESGYSVLEISSSDGKKGAVTAFAMSSSEKYKLNIVPKGINPGMEYKITFDNSNAVFTAYGYEIMSKGLDIYIPASLSSELVLYEINE